MSVRHSPTLSREEIYRDVRGQGQLQSSSSGAGRQPINNMPLSVRYQMIQTVTDAGVIKVTEVLFVVEVGRGQHTFLLCQLNGSFFMFCP